MTKNSAWNQSTELAGHHHQQFIRPGSTPRDDADRAGPRTFNMHLTQWGAPNHLPIDHRDGADQAGVRGVDVGTSHADGLRGRPVRVAGGLTRRHPAPVSARAATAAVRPGPANRRTRRACTTGHGAPADAGPSQTVTVRLSQEGQPRCTVIRCRRDGASTKLTGIVSSPPMGAGQLACPPPGQPDPPSRQRRWTAAEPRQSRYRGP